MGQLVSALCVLAFFASAADAHAQECADGRVADEQGYCCWPGQTFDVEANRCSGPPQCPEGRAASGTECVPATAPAAANDVVSAETPPTRSPDGGLIAAGATLIGVGYLGALVTAIVMGQQTSYLGSAGTRQVVPNWWLGFFPLVHAAAAAGSCCGSYDAPVIIAGVAGALFEVGGAVLLVLGLIGDEEAPSSAVSIGPAELRFGAPSADLGLTLELAL